MASRYSPSGIRRSGDLYQDLIAIEMIINFLSDKDNYKYLLLEAPKMGSLDDVIGVRSDDSLELKQVKYSGYPENLLTWADLLKKKGKKKSLIEKWSKSYRVIKSKHKIHSASIETNKHSQEIKRAIDIHNHVIFDKLDDSIKSKLIEQIGSKESAEDFFNVFCFNISRPNLKDLEIILKRRFSQLGLNLSDWDSLRKAVESWALEKEPKTKITYEKIQDAVHWRHLRSFNQRFPIPADFVIPSEKFHTQLVQELVNRESGCIVIAAPPGTGKSTYLSFLYEYLNSLDLPVIRHHYYLPITEGTVGRLNPEYIAESLMNEIKIKYSDYLGSYKHNNSNFKDLSAWLVRCGGTLRNTGKTLYVIIDGLDHVWQARETGNDLESLFDHLLPAPKGVVIIIGTQPIDDQKIPFKLLQAAPREKWWQLPSLDIQAMRQWIRKHEDKIDLPMNSFDNTYHKDYIFDRLAEDLYKKTDGLPLYLHYALNIFEELHQGINYHTIERLPDYAHDGIVGYYKLLLKNLPDKQKQILYLFALYPISWKPAEIADCLEPKIAISTITESISKTKYLLKDDLSGLTLFHNSLLVFLRAQSDFPVYANMIKPLINDWLDNKAPEYIKQQFFWIVKSEIGDEEPLISGPSRKWVIQAIAKLFPRKGISKVLYKSGLAALSKKDFARVIEIAFLIDYYNTIFEYQPESIENLMYSQLLINDDSSFNRSIVSDITTLTNNQIVYFAEYNRDNLELVKHCFNELDERQKGNRCSKYSESYPYRKSVFYSFLRVAALLDEDGFSQFLDRLLKAHKHLVYEDFDILCQALRKNKKARSLRKLLAMPFSEKQLSIILQHTILLSFEDNFDLTSEVLISPLHPFAAIYSSVNELTSYHFGILDFPSNTIFETLINNPYSDEYDISKCLYDTFFTFLANHLWQHSSRNTEWIEGLPNCWLKQFITVFNDSAECISKLLRAKQQVTFDYLYKNLGTIRRPNWLEDRHLTVFGTYGEKAAHQISLDLLLITKRKEGEVTRDEFENAAFTPYCGPWHLIDDMITQNRCWLTNDAVDLCISSLEPNLDATIRSFYDRAIMFGQLANLCALHNDKRRSKIYVEKCSENLLAYGWHKDLTLPSMMDTIELCYENKLVEAGEMLRRITPTILWIKKYTDGDETKHLIRVLGDIVSKYEPDLLFSHYNWLIENGEYYNAQELIKSIVENSDLLNPNNISLVQNNLDFHSLPSLRKRAKDDEAARDILISIGQSISDIPSNEEKTESEKEAIVNNVNKMSDPKDYPPEKLGDYLRLEKSNIIYSDILEKWVSYWITTPQKMNAYEAVKNQIKEGVFFDEYDSVFNLALHTAGKKEAYQWLVKAHIKRHGWDPFYSHDFAIKRWSIIKQMYPTSWLQFIDDTLRPIFSGEHWQFVTAHLFDALIEYFLFFNKKELATVCARQAIASVEELVSPVTLPKPSWLMDDFSSIS